MSRMTILDKDLWLRLTAPGVLGGAGKAADGGYPPYNIELLSNSESEPAALRITLAVAGFAPNELEVSIDGGELLIRDPSRSDAPEFRTGVPVTLGGGFLESDRYQAQTCASGPAWQVVG